MPGRRQKRAGTTKGHRTERRLQPVPDEQPATDVAGDEAPAVEAPPMPLNMAATAELLPEVRELWTLYWSSTVAEAFDAATVREAIVRLFQQIDQRIVWTRVLAETPLVKGSADNLRKNPLADLVAHLDREIRAGQEHFGMTPAARFRLGIEGGAAANEYERMKAALDAAQARAQPMPDDVGDGAAEGQTSG